jgi:hypothetical protein
VYGGTLVVIGLGAICLIGLWFALKGCWKCWKQRQSLNESNAEENEENQIKIPIE